MSTILDRKRQLPRDRLLHNGLDLSGILWLNDVLRPCKPVQQVGRRDGTLELQVAGYKHLNILRLELGSKIGVSRPGSRRL